MDFKRAHNTITFEHTQVMFQLMGMPSGVVSWVTRVLQSPLAFCIQALAVPEVSWIP